MALALQVHEQKLAAELSAAKRERDHYLAQVDKAKGLAVSGATASSLLSALSCLP